MGKRERVKHEKLLSAFFVTLEDELDGLYKTDRKVQFAIDRLRTRARKRAAFVNPALQPIAFEQFVRTNEAAGKVRNDPTWQVLRDARHYIQVVLERFTTQQFEDQIQNPLCYEYIWDNWRFGPGTSNGVTGTHTAEKISQPMTCTKLSEPFVRKLRSMNPYFVGYDAGAQSGVELVNGSRLQSVPKNQDTVRTIAIEPSGNMALQLAAGLYLEGALRSIGLDIRTQEAKNQRLALAGSIDGSLATIDLRSASDLISVDLVRTLLPPEWFRFLCEIRSGLIDVPGHGEVQLNMISTMGNGFTFPLMTLILTSLIYGFRAQRRGPNLYVDWKTTAVYGDDIIIPTREFEGFVDVLARVGLVVNTDKSYSTGSFRESCGGDYYEGYDVTPFYIESLAGPLEYYTAINKVLEWCGVHKLCLPRSIRFLLDLCGENPRLVPEWYGLPQGIRTAQCPKKFSYLSEVSETRVLTDPRFAVPLICGGYISSSGSDMVYTPRSRGRKCVVRSARLPQGYRDGAHPPSRVGAVSHWISLLLDILR